MHPCTASAACWPCAGSIATCGGPPLEWIETADPEVAALRRGTIAVVANLSGHRASVSLGSPGWEPVFASHEGSRLDNPAHDAVSVPAETTVVLASDHRQP